MTSGPLIQDGLGIPPQALKNKLSMLIGPNRLLEEPSRREPAGLIHFVLESGTALMIDNRQNDGKPSVTLHTQQIPGGGIFDLDMSTGKLADGHMNRIKTPAARAALGTALMNVGQADEVSREDYNQAVAKFTAYATPADSATTLATLVNPGPRKQ